jgi:pimeloyl-ACP methyl ester carboxylesterase
MQEITRDGVRLCYEEAGAGAPPFLFVHGWCCDHTYFAPQFEHFGRDHRAVAVDLRGHGASDKPEQDYTVAGFADDLAFLCDALGLVQPVVVGHSMGGAIALELAARHPSVPGAVVMVDPAPIVVGPELRPMLEGIVAGIAGPDHEAVRRGFVEGMLFLPTDDAAVKARVADQMLQAPQHVAAACMQGIATWDGEAALRSCKVPVLDIVAAAPINEGTVLKAINPDIVVGQTVGAGHFNQLLAAEQVNTMVTRFLAINAPLG